METRGKAQMSIQAEVTARRPECAQSQLTFDSLRFGRWIKVTEEQKKWQACGGVGLHNRSFGLARILNARERWLETHLRGEARTYCNIICWERKTQGGTEEGVLKGTDRTVVKNV